MSAKKLQILHRLRFINQLILRPQIAVIGGYHYSNLGDMALGYSVLEQLKAQSVVGGLQTIYNLEKWVQSPYAILGGGAIGYSDSLEKVHKRYGSSPGKIGILGVDFNETSYDKHLLEMIKEAAWVSCRSNQQAATLRELTDRKDINTHPDIAFSLNSNFCQKIRETPVKKKRKKLLLNLVPLYGTVTNNRIIEPVLKYETERPELYKNFQLMHDSYNKGIRKLVSESLKNNYEVETAPFTPDDAKFSQIVLEGLPVIHRKYSADPYEMLKRIANADWVLATRYHALIFAIKAGIKLTAIAYARKNERLLEELEISKTSYITTDDLAGGIDSFPEPIKIKNDLVTEFEAKSRDGILKCLRSLIK